MDDILKRLKDSSSNESSHELQCRCFDAADEIERNRAAIDELVATLNEARGQLAETLFVFRVPIPEASFERYDTIITKHTQQKEQ